MPPSFEKREIIHDAVSFETAHINEWYPFGRGRCLRKIWVETAIKGAKKGEQRVVTCTTKKLVNEPYTTGVYDRGFKIVENSSGTPQGTAVMQHFDRPMNPDGFISNPAYWNKPKLGNYHHMVMLYLRQYPDSRFFVRMFALHIHSEPMMFTVFCRLLAGDDLSSLRPDERDRYIGILNTSKRYNSSSWARWDGLMVPEQTAKVEEWYQNYESIDTKDSTEELS